MKAIVASFALLVLCGSHAAARQPNIVFILGDDLGQRDLGCYGSVFHQTPNIDALAKRGMRFTQAYSASPLCSPTRASILTGLSPARIGITAPVCHFPKPSPYALKAGEFTDIGSSIPAPGGKSGIVRLYLPAPAEVDWIELIVPGGPPRRWDFGAR